MNPDIPSVNPLSAMRQGEREIFNIKRHPVGILITYTIAGLILLTVAVFIFGFGPSLAPNSRHQIITVGSIFFIIFTIIVTVFVLIAQKVYWGNAWILTNDSLTQIKQSSLFDKQSSQLSLENLEDVTAEQDGVFPNMFKYGSIVAETAGERSKFTFSFCPNPNLYAQQILQAREEFEQSHRQEIAGTGPGPAAPAPNPPVNTTPPPA